MVSEELRMFEEEQRKASAITQAKQCAWTKWNDIEPIKLSWKSLIAMEPLAISFLLRSTYDLLPNATNLKLWGYTNGDIPIRRCPWCNDYRRRKWTLRYEFKSWTRLIAFHIALIPSGKVWIQLYSLQLWVNSRADWVLQPWWGN